jgi:hypothetical protein
MRVSRKRRDRECNSSTNEPHSFALALGQVAVEQTPRSGCTQLHLDPSVVGEEPVGVLVPARPAQVTNEEPPGISIRGRQGLGISVFAERTGPGTPAFAARGMVITPGFERVELVMDPSGSLEARIGSSPHGQGLKTTLAQLIADETGIAPDKIRIVAGDTDRCPYGWGTFASRSLVIAGGACKLASATLYERIRAVAGQMLEAAASDIEIGDGRAFVRGTDLSVELRQLARAAYHQAHRFREEDLRWSCAPAVLGIRFVRAGSTSCMLDRRIGQTAAAPHAAGRARAVSPVRGPASESLRRTNPRESGEDLPVYGDLAGRRLCRGMILARSLRAESRVRVWIDRWAGCPVLSTSIIAGRSPGRAGGRTAPRRSRPSRSRRGREIAHPGRPRVPLAQPWAGRRFAKAQACSTLIFDRRLSLI